MRLFFIVLFILFNVICTVYAGDSEDDFPNNLTEDDLFLFSSSLIDILGSSDFIPDNEIRDDEFYGLQDGHDNAFTPLKLETQNITFPYSVDLDLGSDALIPFYTEQERSFLDSLEEKTKISISHQDICIAFKECLDDNFASYLSLKKNSYIFKNF